MTGRIWKYILGPAFVLAAGLFLWRCSEDSISPTESHTARGSPTNIIVRPKEGLVELSNKFGLKLFKEISKKEGDRNVFVSPLSVSTALGMALNGANGNTFTAMRQTLEFAGLTLQEANESYKDLIDVLTSLDPNVQFDIANSMWYREDYTQPYEDFIQRCQDYFYSLVSELDFNDPMAASIINAWVAENTNGRITEIVDDPIGRDLCMFLINAIYFKGNWTYRFDENQTLDWPFHLPNGSTITCRMMKQKALHKYCSREHLQAIELPYGDGAFCMIILLPKQETDLDVFINQLTMENVNYWLSCLSSDSVNVYLPKFHLEYGRELKDDLTTMGMGIAFDPGRADFSNMYPGGGVWIDKVKHKTFVEVNEAGTEAAAVTDVEFAFGPTDPIFRADFPFIFLIRENESQTILFVGKIMDPTAE